MFCLHKEFNCDHVCSDSTNELMSDKELNCDCSEADISQILFGSPASGIHEDHVCSHGITANDDFTTPCVTAFGNNRSSTTTPQNLDLDPITTSWSEDMATPFPLNMSSLSCFDSVSSVFTNSTHKSTEKKKMTAPSKKLKQAPRRLFKDINSVNTGSKDCLLQNDDTKGSCDNHVILTTPPAMVGGSFMDNSISSLDVLFMSNSQLDQFDKEARPMDQKEAGPMDQKEAGPIDQMEVGPMDQKEVGPINQLEAGPIDQKEAGPIDRMEVGPINQKEARSINQKEVDPINQKEAGSINQKEVGPINHKEVGPARLSSNDQIDKQKVKQIAKDTTSESKGKKGSLQTGKVHVPNINEGSASRFIYPTNSQIQRTCSDTSTNGTEAPTELKKKRHLISISSTSSLKKPKLGTVHTEDGNIVQYSSSTSRPSLFHTSTPSDFKRSHRCRQATSTVVTPPHFTSLLNVSEVEGRGDGGEGDSVGDSRLSRTRRSESESLLVADLDWEEFNTFTQATIASPSTNRDEHRPLPDHHQCSMVTGEESNKENTNHDDGSCHENRHACFDSHDNSPHDTRKLCENIDSHTETALCGIQGTLHEHQYTKDSSSVASDGIGFTTASGKVIKVSEKALESVRNLFEEKDEEIGTVLTNSDIEALCSISDTSSTAEEEGSAGGRGSGSAGGRGSGCTDTRDQKSDRISLGSSPIHQRKVASPLACTKTSPSDHMTVSSDHMTIGNVTFDHMSFDHMVADLNIEPESVQEKTITDSFLESINQSVQDSTQLLQGVCNNEQIVQETQGAATSTTVTLQPSLSSVCFTTASGKPVSITEGAIKAAQRFLQDSPSSKSTGVAGLPNRITSDEPLLLVARTDLRQTPTHEYRGIGMRLPPSRGVGGMSSTVPDTVQVHADKPPNRTGLTNAGGFSTASGKMVKVSEKSLTAAKKLLYIEEEAEREQYQEGNIQDLVSVGLLNIKAKNSVNDSDKPLRSVKLVEEETKRDRASFGFGFTTAGGRAVSVSEESLKSAKKLFAADDDDTPPVYPPPPSFSIGFSTASGKPVGVSESSLNSVKKLFQDEANICEQFKPSLTSIEGGTETAKQVLPVHKEVGNSFSTGFSTAGGKKVEVNSESLRAVKELLYGEGEEASFNTGFTSTESKGVSTKLLEIVKKGDAMRESGRCQDSVGSCFSTASGKAVSVSKESLEAARLLFKASPDDCDDQGTSLCTATSTTEGTFLTASGKPVHVCDKSLEAAKRICREEDIHVAEPIVRKSNPRKSLSKMRKKSAKQTNSVCVPMVTNKPRVPPTKEDGRSQLDSRPLTHFFTSASGKTVPVCEESLRAVKNSRANEEVPVRHSSLESEVISNATTPPASTNVSNHMDTSSVGNNGTFRRQQHSNKSTGQVSGIEDILCDRHPHRLLVPKLPGSDIGPTTDTTPHGLNQYATDSSNHFNTTGGLEEDSSLLTTDDLTSKDHMEQDGSILSPMLFSNSEIELFEDTTLTQLNMADATDRLTDTPSPPPIEGGAVKPQYGYIMDRIMQNNTRTPLGGLDRIKYTKDELVGMNVIGQGMRVTVATAVDYRFPLPRSLKEGAKLITGDRVELTIRAVDRVNDGIGANTLWRYFRVSPGVDSSLISKKWFFNHYKWIVWKLAALELAFPRTHGGSCLTLDWCLKQLKYRYDVEIDKAKRSLIHLICEEDDIPNGPMVLCISAIDLQNQRIEVTDGWYSIPAVIDHHLTGMVCRGSLSIGFKVFICGAEMSESGRCGHPLEVSETKCLRLCANHVRRARWYTRMGRVSLKHPPLFPLSSVLSQGGTIPSLQVVIARVFPLIYMEKTDDGRKVFRTIKMEENRLKELEKTRNRKMEELYRKVEKECEEAQNKEEKFSMHHKRRSGRITPHYVRTLKDGESLYHTLQATNDPDLLMRLMSPTQHALLQSYQDVKVQENQQIMRRRLEEAMKKSKEKFDNNGTSIPLLRILIAPNSRHKESSDTLEKGSMLTVWRPTSDLMELLQEGHVVRIHWATSAQKSHEGRLQLSTTKKTRFERTSQAEVTLTEEGVYQPRQCLTIPEIVNPSIQYGYFDTVGRVVAIRRSQVFQRSKHDMIYVADNEMNLLKVWFWDDIERLCIQSLVVPGAVLAFCNLQYIDKATSSSKVSECFASDRSLVTGNPSSEHLSASLLDISGISKSQEQLLMGELQRMVQDL